MADLIRIGLELDASVLTRAGAQAEQVLAKLKTGSKLTAEEVKQLNTVLGATGTAGQNAVVGVVKLEKTFQGTQTAARSTTQVFNQLRGGMASMAQAAIGQTVPGLAAVTSQLGSLAIGSPALVGALAGLAAVATAFRVITTEAREAEKAQKDLIDQLIKGAQFSDEGNRLAKQIQAGRAGLARLAPQIALGEAVRDARASEGLKEDLSNTRRLNELLLKQQQIKEGIQVAQDRLDQLSKKNIQEIRDINIKAAKDASKAWQDHYQELIDQTGRIMGLRAKIGAAFGAAIGGATGPTGSGTDPTGRSLIGFAFGAANGGNARGTGPVFQQPGTPQRGFLGGLFDSVKGNFDPKMILSGLATGGISSIVGAGIGVIKSFFGGRSAEETRRLAEEEKRLADARAEAARQVAEFNRALEDDLSIRRLQAAGRTEDAAILRLIIEQENELRQARERGITDANESALRDVQAQELLALRQDQSAASAKRAADALEELRRNAERIADERKSLFSWMDDLTAGDDPVARRELQFQRDIDRVFKAIDDGLLTFEEAFKLSALLTKRFQEDIEKIKAGQLPPATPGPDAASSGIRSRTTGTVSKSITQITETTALTLAHIDRSILAENRRQSHLLERIERNTRNGSSSTTVTQTFNGNVNTASGPPGELSLDGIDIALGRKGRQDQRRIGDSTL